MVSGDRRGLGLRAATVLARAYVPKRWLPQRATALGYGLACHLLFAAAVCSMAVALFTGMRLGRGPFQGPAAVVANALLLLLFPFAHSTLLTRGGRAAMARLAPFGVGGELSTTVFATIASLQLLTVFWGWSPSGAVWWVAHGWAKGMIAVAAAGAWLLLGKSMADAQLSLQTGFLGWSAVLTHRTPVYRPFATAGLYGHVRQPIYISFAMILWLSAVWTPDQLVLAVLWTGYCIAGSALKERRYLRYFGERFRRYQAAVPFWVPGGRRRRPEAGG